MAPATELTSAKTQSDLFTDEEFEEFKDKAFTAKDQSYSPYSKFRVGCALVSESGKIYLGANVENASYGGCICAERSAIICAVMDGEKKFKALGITSDMDEIITPCGICRQFIREFGTKIAIFMFDKNREHVQMTIEELLPLSFGPEQLN